MTANNTIRISTVATPPCEAHNGWVSISVDDEHYLFTPEERLYFEGEFLSEQILVSLDQRLAGFKKTGGIYDYSEDLCGLEFLLPLDKPAIKQIKVGAFKHFHPNFIIPTSEPELRKLHKDYDAAQYFANATENPAEEKRANEQIRILEKAIELCEYSINEDDIFYKI